MFSCLIQQSVGLSLSEKSERESYAEGSAVRQRSLGLPMLMLLPYLKVAVSTRKSVLGLIGGLSRDAARVNLGHRRIYRVWDGEVANEITIDCI